MGVSLIEKSNAVLAGVLQNSSRELEQLKNYTRIIEEMEEPPAWETWVFGLLVVTGCSFSAPLGMLVVPLFQKKTYERIMTFLIALGIGALSGSTLFVMIPQAFNLVELAGQYDYKVKCWIIIGALYTFFSVDRMLMYGLELRNRHITRRKIHKSTLNSLMKRTDGRNFTENTDVNSDRSSDRSTRDQEKKKRNEAEKNELKDELEIAMINNNFTRTFSTRKRMAVLRAVDKLDRMEFRDENGRNSKCEGNDFLKSVNEEIQQRSLPALKFSASDARRKSVDPPVIYVNNQRPSEDDSISLDIQVVEKKVFEPAKIEVAAVAYMIIFGSSANNFVDGMSLGAAFADSILGGLSIGTAVFSEQFPQELGTLAILMNSGLGFKKALIYNMIPIVLSYIGFAVGVLLDEVDEGYDDYIFAISSGMYLYIFLGTLIPEIRESCHELAKEDLKESFIVTILQVIGIAFGVGFLFLMGEMNNEGIA
ncbi:unnamed protein product, partial [Mesorhabditis belari]|uniref:Uncharacterized protein n=1 Tax=Mesorhabditis belari TaxID=2138241 RepID=A0AAF3EIS3_9BILA